MITEVLYCNEETARNCYRNIVKYGNKVAGYHNLAISYLKETGLRRKAYYYLHKAYKLCNGQDSPIIYSLAIYYLSARKFKKGYKYYVSHCGADSQDDIDWSNRFKNRWQGGVYKDKTLFVYGDQGFGDQLQFVRYIPYLANKFKKVKVMVAETLIDLFIASYQKYKNVEFYPMKDTFPIYDKSLELSHSLYYLKMDFKHIPYSNGYLIPNYKRVQEYKTKYFDTNNLKIGSCWEAGHVGFRESIHRTLNIELFEDIINLKKANIYSFQVKPSLDNYKKYSKLIDLSKK